MKNLSLILNGILFIAVAILFYLHFSSKNGTVATDATKKDSITAAPVKLPEIRSVNGPIAFINYDMLVEKYPLHKDLEKQFDAFVQSKENELVRRQNALMEAVGNYQQLAPDMTEQSRAAREQQLAEEEQKLLMDRQRMSGEIADKRDELNKQFLNKIDDYLKGLSKEKNYSYVFTYSKGGPATIVFANDSLEITTPVIEGLNKEYKRK